MRSTELTIAGEFHIKVSPQSAPPDCGFSTSATPKAFGAISPAGISRYNYKIVMISQDKFLIIFYLRGVFGFPLVSKEKATALQKSAGSQFSAFRLPGV